MSEERIQKLLAEAGVASRRASEALIAAGRVRVNGRVARLGDRADPAAARLEVDGRPVGIGVAKAYLALHKPGGVTSTTRDRHAPATVLDLVPTAMVPDGTRLYPVGRLDQDSEGLLLLTNDGEWAERILHPRFGVERIYAVALARPLDRDRTAALEDGIELEEGIARLARPLRQIGRTEVASIAMTLVPPVDSTLVWYRATLRQGWKRQLRRMFGAVEAPIARLVRIAIGPVRLGDLHSGAVRRLTSAEVAALGGGRGGGARATAEGYPRRR
ncbi:MAG TPA: pseudouridine synthase [Candidatus Limnocylindrales bacterium]|nr:pseudouridine synthase [Candidatus Limnocylindrales bacterium]